MPLHRYSCSWFSALEWKWAEAEFIAESEEQVRAHLDANVCAEEFRTGTYRQLTDGMGTVADSLRFDPSPLPVTLPYQLPPYP